MTVLGISTRLYTALLFYKRFTVNRRYCARAQSRLPLLFHIFFSLPEGYQCCTFLGEKELFVHCWHFPRWLNRRLPVTHIPNDHLPGVNLRIQTTTALLLESPLCWTGTGSAGATCSNTTKSRTLLPCCDAAVLWTLPRRRSCAFAEEGLHTGPAERASGPLRSGRSGRRLRW